MEPSGVRLAAVEHYDNAAVSLRAARDNPGPPQAIQTSYLDAITECLLGLLRVQMQRLEAGG
jgi:hypothetical protein